MSIFPFLFFTPLSSKAAVSAQETVETANIPSRSVDVAANELPSFIAGLPRLLAEDLTIQVSGSLTESILIAGFYGSGQLRIIAGAEGCTITNTARIIRCKIPVFLEGFILQTDQISEGIIEVGYSPSVYLSGITIDGDNASGLRGVSALNSMVRLNDCCIKNCDTAVLACGGSLVSVYTSGGSEFTGNTTGAYVWHGGIIVLSGVPDTLGGAANIKQGGIVVKSDGTLL